VDHVRANLGHRPGGLAMRFYIGLHQPSDAKYFGACCISVNRIRERLSTFTDGAWITDSGAFTELSRWGRWRESVQAYAEQIRRWTAPNLLAAVSQDYMTEPEILAKTGLTIADHQRLTIERWDALNREDCGGTYLMPVLQGYAPADYVRHLDAYGDRLAQGAWVGVGSVCKRNGDPVAIEQVLLTIKAERPDLRLHGFGLKSTALGSALVFDSLHSADSMAWSFAARRKGGNPNCRKEAARWLEALSERPQQCGFGFL